MPTIVIVAILVLLLLALLTVQFARRDAAAERAAARQETETIREEARSLMSEAQRREERVAMREREFANDQRNAQAYARGLDERVAVIARDEKRLLADRERLAAEYSERLAEVADMTVQEARDSLMAHIKESAETATAKEVRRAVKRAKEQANAKAREVLIEAMQRQVAETTSQGSIVRVELPSEEMKGRIIGREGRNIRAFEALTGVNVIVEEGVNAVQLSSFDVERREIALVTLTALVDDGRIQPHRVEAAYAQAVAQAPQRAHEAGLDAIDAAGVDAVAAPLIEILGRLRLRTSYGQNVLSHSVEAAQVAATVAELVGADVELARRAAFLHDIGKAFTREREGTHASIGAAVAQEHGESSLVVNAIAAHHDEVTQDSVEAVIVQIADAVSASRPGARREDIEGYVDRIESLEKMVGENAGVSQVYAMAAGRELRVVVEPTAVGDEEVDILARTIARQIENDFNFVGEIRVTVVRETRADSIAGQA